MRLRLVLPTCVLLLSMTTTAAAHAAAAGPLITGLDPDTCTADHGDLTLVVHGSGFVMGSPAAGLRPSVVRWNGDPVPTTVDSVTQLTALVPGSLLEPGLATVTVFNQGAPPLILDAESKPRAFAVTPGTPTVSSIDPQSAVAGGPGFDLRVDGAGFYAGSVVCWDGDPLTTTVVSPAHLEAAVPASAVATAGTAQVTVRNGPAGSPASGALVFTIAFALPVLTSISPTQAWAGYLKDDLVLTADGSGFVSGARITIGSAQKAATSFVGPTQLTVPLTAADLATPGTYNVGVRNPDGGVSATTRPLVVAAETSMPDVTISGGGARWYQGPATLTFSAVDDQSGVQKTLYQCPPAVAAWTDGASYSTPKSWQGTMLVSARAVDWCGNTGAAESVPVHVDMTRPVTKALNNPTVRPGTRKVTLKYRVNEPPGLSPTVVVRIRVLGAGGHTLIARTKTVPVNTDLSWSFTARFSAAVGTYGWSVRATDLAGNTQAKPVGSGTITAVPY